MNVVLVLIRPPDAAMAAIIAFCRSVISYNRLAIVRAAVLRAYHLPYYPSMS